MNSLLVYYKWIQLVVRGKLHCIVEDMLKQFDLNKLLRLDGLNLLHVCANSNRCVQLLVCLGSYF